MKTIHVELTDAQAARIEKLSALLKLTPSEAMMVFALAQIDALGSLPDFVLWWDSALEDYLKNGLARAERQGCDEEIVTAMKSAKKIRNTPRGVATYLKRYVDAEHKKRVAEWKKTHKPVAEPSVEPINVLFTKDQAKLVSDFAKLIGMCPGTFVQMLALREIEGASMQDDLLTEFRVWMDAFRGFCAEKEVPGDEFKVWLRKELKTQSVPQLLVQAQREEDERNKHSPLLEAVG